MRFPRPIILLALVVVVLRPSAAATASDEQLTVNIVPTGSRGSDRSIELYGPTDHFHVVVTNNTGQPIRLWREWCEWGYFNLSFEVRSSDGKISQISKRNRGWDKNFPDWTSIPARANLVLDVSLDPSIWQNSPLAGPSGKAIVRLRATYQVRRDKEAKEDGIWVGKVSSPEDEFSIYWIGENAKKAARRLQGLEKRDAAQPGVAADGAARRR